jgi:hypothetical protein
VYFYLLGHQKKSRRVSDPRERGDEVRRTGGRSFVYDRAAGFAPPHVRCALDVGCQPTFLFWALLVDEGNIG